MILTIQRIDQKTIFNHKLFHKYLEEFFFVSMKEGSILEGIFATYCALILADPEDGMDMSKMRRKIRETRIQSQLKEYLKPGTKTTTRDITINKSFPKDDNFGYPVTNDEKVLPRIQNNSFVTPGRREYRDPQTKRLVQSPPDLISVNLSVRLKANEVEEAYGRNLEGMSPGMDYGRLESKINQLIESRGTMFFRKLIVAKNRFLKNNKTDTIQYQVIADGVAGESTGGNIKADVLIRITANGKSLISENINFSLKSESSTIENVGLIRGVQEVYNMFSSSLSGQSAKDAQVLVQQLTSSRKVNRVALTAFFNLISNNLPSGTSLTSQYFQYFKTKAFGADKSQVVNITRGGLQEMHIGYIEYLEKYGAAGRPLLLEVKSTPGDIRFVSSNVDGEEFLFKIRLKKEHGEIKKMMIETGNLAHPPH